jgi:hypothetical protein
VRVAIFVAVVAAHLALLWLFTSLHRWALLPAEDEAAITPIFLPPLQPETAVEPIWEPPEWDIQVQARVPEPTQRPVQQESQQELTRAHLATSETGAASAPRPSAESQAAPALQENSTLQANTAFQANMPLQASPELGSPQPSDLTSGAPDWRAAAAAAAQTSAQHIVEAEDDAARKAAALTSRFKPLPGPRVAGPQFAWDYAHTHRVTSLQGGGFVVALNDRCAVVVFIFPMIGCSLGPKPPANGDLFKNMHRPAKFGDWDWRVEDP